MENSSLRIRIISILVLGALIGVSIWFGCALASSESFHHKDIVYLIAASAGYRHSSGQPDLERRPRFYDHTVGAFHRTVSADNHRKSYLLLAHSDRTWPGHSVRSPQKKAVPADWPEAGNSRMCDLHAGSRDAEDNPDD